MTSTPALSEAERAATAPFANLGPAAQGFLRVPLQHLLAAQHPGYGDPWGVGTIRLTDLDPTTGESTAWEAHTSTCRLYEADADDIPCRACDITRVRYLAEHGWPPIEEDPHPITIDVGVGSYIPSWCILDGNHRILAAWLRRDTTIDVAISGDWDRACAVLLEGDDSAWWR